MSLSACAKCWETPCRCGHDYKSWSIDQLNEQIAMLTRVRDEKIAEGVNSAERAAKAEKS